MVDEQDQGSIKVGFKPTSKVVELLFPTTINCGVILMLFIST